MTPFVNLTVRSLAAVALLAVGAAAWAETQTGKTIEARVILAYKVNDAAADAMLPGGWKLLTLPKGPLAGSNLLVSFIDRHLLLDAEGNPAEPHSARAVALVAYGVKPGVEGARTFVLRVYETEPVANSYDNGVATRISREMSLSGPAGSLQHHQEVWVAEPVTGGSLDMRVSYTPGRPGWSAAEARPYSSVDPDYHLIYRYDSLTELAMSTALGKELAGEVTLRTDIAELTGMFDGSEVLTGVLVIPVRVRDIFVP